MFTKYLIVIDGDINIRDYKELVRHVFTNVDLTRDLLLSNGPLDVLDHSSDTFSFGGKLGVDATIKHIEEIADKNIIENRHIPVAFNDIINLFDRDLIKNFNINLFKDGIPILVITVNRSEDVDVIEKVKKLFRTIDHDGIFRLILAVDHTVDPDDLYMVAWQLLGNSDPKRDHEYISPCSIFIDGTIKAYRKGGFSRKWPNVVCSDFETISAIDLKWESLGLGPIMYSPSARNLGLCRQGTDEIIINKS